MVSSNIFFINHILYMAEIGMYILGSLLGAGALMKNHKSNVNKEHKTKPSNYNDEKVGTNVYNSRDYYRHKETEYNKVKQNWDDAKDTINTGIVPMYYNTLNVTHDSEKIPNRNYNNKLIYNVIDMLSNETKTKIKEGIKSSPINDSARNIKPEWGIIMDRPRDTSKDLEGQNPLDQIGGGLVAGQEDFTHNNMVPFYGGNITQDTRAANRANEGKLELYTGQFKLNQHQKKECGLFFEPVTGMTNIHGVSGEGQHRDLSRYNPNNTGKKNNEAPEEQIQVGPGLNSGYTAQPDGGFHNTLRVMPKDITQLRVDPVLETTGRVKSGNSHISKRTLAPQVYRNKQELLVENHNGERNFTTVGAVKGRTLRPNLILRHTHRKKSKQHTGGASNTVIKHRIAPKSKVSTRINHLHTSPRNAGSSVNRANDYGKSGITARANNRQITGSKTRIVGTTSHVKRNRSRLQDTARKTKKQSLLRNPRPNGNVKMQNSKGIAYNSKEWAANPTIKETTENANHVGFQGQVNGGNGVSYNPKEWAARTTVGETTEDSNHIGFQGQVNGGNGVSYNPTEWAARTTVGETTEDSNHIGFQGQVNGGNGISYNSKDWAARTTVGETTEDSNHIGFQGQVNGGNGISYNPKDWVARTTVKETTHFSNYGNIGSSAHKKHTVWNTKHKAKQTIRETTEKLDRYGTAVGNSKHTVYDPNDKARVTIRETTGDTNHIGGASVIVKKQIAWNPNEKARKTIRETTEQNNHNGNIGASSIHKNGAYSTSKWDAKNTNRQFTSDNAYTSGANSINKKSISYDSAYNARTNVNKEVISKGRRPKGGGPKLGHNGICMEHKKLDSDRVNSYPRMKSGTAGQMFNANRVFTSEKNHLPQQDTRLDTGIINALKRNPLAQSLASWN